MSATRNKKSPRDSLENKAFEMPKKQRLQESFTEDTEVDNEQKQDPFHFETIAGLEVLEQNEMDTPDNQMLIKQLGQHAVTVADILVELKKNNIEMTDIERNAILQYPFNEDNSDHSYVYWDLAAALLSLKEKQLLNNATRIAVSKAFITGDLVNPPRFVDSLCVLNDSNLLNNDNVNSVTQELRYCREMAQALVILHNGGLLSDETREILVQFGQFKECAAEAFCELNRAGMLIKNNTLDDNIVASLTLKNGEFANSIAQAHCILQEAKLHNMDTMQALLVAISEDSADVNADSVEIATELYCKLWADGILVNGQTLAKLYQSKQGYHRRAEKLTEIVRQLHANGLMIDNETFDILIRHKNGKFGKEVCQGVGVLREAGFSVDNETLAILCQYKNGRYAMVLSETACSVEKYNAFIAEHDALDKDSEAEPRDPLVLQTMQSLIEKENARIIRDICHAEEEVKKPESQLTPCFPSVITKLISSFFAPSRQIESTSKMECDEEKKEEPGSKPRGPSNL